MTVELTRALAVMAEPPTQESVAVAKALGLGTPVPEAYTAVFALEVYPYASVYLGGEGMLGGEARDRVAGFWHALAMTPPAEPDHLSVLLGLLAELSDAATTDARAAHAKQALLWEHILPWVPMALTKVRELAIHPFDAWADLVLELLTHEASVTPGSPALPLHLREAPGLPDEPESVVAALLAPVRTGMVVVRSDLARAARDLGLGLRQGERRFMLQAMLDQDPNAITEWLVAEAGAWEARHEGTRPILGVLADFWIQRARSTADYATNLTADYKRAVFAHQSPHADSTNSTEV